MSCSACNCSPCHCHTECDSNDEPLSSALNNFITEFYGSVTKSCVNNAVVWTLPCNLQAGISGFPRNSGEGTACYFLRYLVYLQTIVVFPGNKGYRMTTLSATDVVLYRAIDVINQDFQGTLVAPVTIFVSSNQATAGDEFYLYLSGVVVTAVNSLTINSDATPLFVFNSPGTLNGFLKVVYTGTAWKLLQNFVVVS